jgi:hypothetical protein
MADYETRLGYNTTESKKKTNDLYIHAYMNSTTIIIF